MLKFFKSALNAYIKGAGNYPLPMTWAF